MHYQDMLNELRRVPFEPFAIRLSNNALYEITHPDQVSVGRTAIVIGVRSPDLPQGVADQFVEASLLHVAEFLPRPTPTQPPAAPADRPSLDA